MKPWITKLKAGGACEGALKWCGDYNSLQAAWNSCQNGIWMIWLLNTRGWPSDKARKKFHTKSIEIVIQHNTEITLAKNRLAADRIKLSKKEYEAAKVRFKTRIEKAREKRIVAEAAAIRRAIPKPPYSKARI